MRASSPDISFDVETSRLASQPIEIRRGETVTLTPRFLLNTAVLPLTNSETCVLYYRSTDMTTGLYYAITGAVHNATGGQARVTWTAANCPAATNLQADFVVSSSNVINLRAYANIVLRDSVFAQASTVTNPPTVTAADLSVLTGQVAGTLINAPDLSWDVESSALSIKPLQIRRGETVTLTPRFLLNSAVVSFTNTAQAALYYRPSNLGTGLFYAAAGTLHNATNGQVRINWTSGHCPSSATNLQGEIIVLYPGVTNLRAAVSITLQDSIFGSALTAADPTAWRLIDWSSVSNLNLSSAPFALSAGSLIWSNIGGDPASSTSLVAYIQSQVSGISAGTATQIAEIVAGSVMSTGTAAAAAAAPWSGLTGIPSIWPGTATDSVARISGTNAEAQASLAQQAASNAQATADSGTNHAARTDNPHSVTPAQIGALSSESDPLSLHTQSLFVAWTSSGGTATTNQVIASSPLLTNGYASSSYDSSGSGGTVSLQTSADSNTWATATATNGPVYARVYVTIISPGDSVSVSNIVINSWTWPDLWHRQSDLKGQIVLVDDPSEARQVANRSYVLSLVSNATPDAWAQYPASTNVSLANHALDFGSSYTILSTGDYSAWSYTPVTMSAGTDDVWRLQFGGQDIMRLEPSYTLLSITNFTLNSNGFFAASVWTGGVAATPYIQYTTNLLSPAWSAVTLTTNSYPTEITPGSYLLQWTNTFPSPSYFRAACGDPTSNIVRFLWPLFAQQSGGNVLTNLLWSQIPDIPSIWPGTATDTVARISGTNAEAQASLAQQAASNAQATADSGTNHAARTDNPHTVTPAQIGAVPTNDAVYLTATTNVSGGILTIAARVIGLTYANLTNALATTYATLTDMISATNRLQSVETGVLNLTNSVNSATNRVRSLETGVLNLTNSVISLTNGVLNLTNSVNSATNRLRSLETGVLNLTNTCNAISNRVYAAVTNEYYGGWYSMNNAVTSLLTRINEATIITQIVSWAETPGACTSFFFATTYWSNRVTGATAQVGVPHSTTGSAVNCSFTVPAGGGLWQASCINATAATNVTFSLRGIQ